jgi:NAD(P)-dependent dehydrogenase (short-subunit alcohol dehydrogenase family)
MQQRVALITGAGRGIGRAAAHELGRLGYRLALVARTESDLRETQRAARDAIVIPGDVTRHEFVSTAVANAVETFGRLDAVIHCAGLAPVLSVEETTPQRWQEVIDTNLSAAFRLARAAWPIFKKQRGGVIVNLSSMASRDPFPGFAAYGAAKAGVNLLGLALAREGQEHGIRVHTLVLGAVETAMFRAIRTEEQHPRDLTLAPEDVARTIGLCVCGDLRFTSGETIVLRKTV